MAIQIALHKLIIVEQEIVLKTLIREYICKIRIIKHKDYSGCVTQPHCRMDEAYRQRLIDNPEILENEKRINEQIKNNSNTFKAQTIINAREEELKKIYYEKINKNKQVITTTPN